MKIFKFLTTFSNQLKKFATVAYHIQERASIPIIEPKALYKEANFFGISKPPIKYAVYKHNNVKFLTKVYFLGNEGTSDPRGNNYLATTIRLADNQPIQPLDFFLDESIWQTSYTGDDDRKFANNHHLEPIEIKVETQKYNYILQHINEITREIDKIVSLMDLFLLPEKKRILVNVYPTEYSLFTFSLLSLLPDEFTSNITITLHPFDTQREDADIVETITYPEELLRINKKMYTILDFCNQDYQNTTQNHDYYQFLKTCFQGDSPDEKIRLFHDVYTALDHKEHTVFTLNETTKVTHGDLRLLWNSMKPRTSDFKILAAALVEKKWVTPNQFLEVLISEKLLGSTPFNELTRLINHYGNNKNFHISKAITEYSTSYQLHTDNVDFLLQKYISNSSLDNETCSALLKILLSDWLNLVKNGQQQEKYQTVINTCKIHRPDLFSPGTELLKTYSMIDFLTLLNHNNWNAEYRSERIKDFFKQLVGSDSEKNEFITLYLKSVVNNKIKSKDWQLHLHPLFQAFPYSEPVISALVEMLLTKVPEKLSIYLSETLSLYFCNTNRERLTFFHKKISKSPQHKKSIDAYLAKKLSKKKFDNFLPI